MAGAPTPDPFTDRQLLAIEQTIDRLVTQQLSQLLASHEFHRDIRLAKTVQHSSTYPTNGDTFWIRFLDCAFNPLSAGSTTLTALERTAEGDTDDSADVLAREINGQFLPEGTLVFALWQRGLSGDPSSYGEWWVQAALGGMHWIEFELTADLGASDSSGSADVVSGYGDSLPSVGTSVTVLNLQTDSGGTYMFSGVTGKFGLAVWKGGTNYQIFQLNCPSS